MPKVSERALNIRRQKLRDALHAHPEGLTVASLLVYVPRIDDRCIYHDLTVMPDTYIDRWIPAPHRGQAYNHRSQAYLAVWCAVVPPENCPHPEEQDEQP